MIWYEGALTKFRDYCASIGIYRLSDVNARSLRSNLINLEENGHNVGGISNLYRAVRSILRWSAEKFDLPTLSDALKKVPSSTPFSEPLDPIPLEYVNAMVAQCTPRTFTGERDKAILLTLLDTGIRHQELTDLTINDINLDDGSILIREGKGGKSRPSLLASRHDAPLAAICPIVAARSCAMLPSGVASPPPMRFD